MTPPPAPIPLPDTVVLVLQGGGALGSFQGGVYEALAQAQVGVDWVAGISIGAVNAAIIAGNPPERRIERLRTFWDKLSGGMPDLPMPGDDRSREIMHMLAAGTVAAFGVPGLFRPRWTPGWLAPHGSAAATSLYDTEPLRESLDALIDWDLLNDGPVRLSVGAVDVESGNFEYFDTKGDTPTRIDARHVMASGALPPGLPAIEIDGRHWWDGGIVSNTPLSHILDNQADGDMLLFQVDLFPARGPLPNELSDVLSREKDIRYSSRTRQVTDQYLRLRREHGAVRRLLAKLPDSLADDPDVATLRAAIAERAVSIVQLIYRNRPWETGARDFEFSRSTMDDHWTQGREAVARTMQNGDLLAQNILDGRTAAFDLGD